MVTLTIGGRDFQIRWPEDDESSTPLDSSLRNGLTKVAVSDPIDPSLVAVPGVLVTLTWPENAMLNLTRKDVPKLTMSLNESRHIERFPRVVVERYGASVLGHFITHHQEIIQFVPSAGYFIAQWWVPEEALTKYQAYETIPMSAIHDAINRLL